MTEDPNSSSPTSGDPDQLRNAQFQLAVDQVRRALATLRYGQVLVTVQDGVIVQIDRTEKKRLR